jgi:hypothetical protein
VQMPGIEYYIDIFKNDTNIQQNIWYLLQGYNDIRGNIKTFDTRLVWYLISVFIPILIPGADLYTSPTLVQTSNFRVTSFWQAFIHSSIKWLVFISKDQIYAERLSKLIMFSGKYINHATKLKSGKYTGNPELIFS